MPLRISLTISGAISLGAYEGGALAALLYAVRPLVGGEGAPVQLDVMSGASAGSITALLAARALLSGHDPEKVMAGAWVKRDNLGSMLARGADAPLSVDELRDMARDLLDPQDSERDHRRQKSPVRLSYTLACLRGLEYQFKRLGRDAVPSVTYTDYFDHTLTADTPLEDLTGPENARDRVPKYPLDAALASAANAMGFPPYLLDRTADRAAYTRNHVDNLPPKPTLWYTDGGTLDNEPLGRAFDLANEVAGDGGRLHLLIHPHPTGATGGTHWADPQVQPTFAQTAVRALSLQRTQSLYRDLKQAEKTNSRVTWLARLSERLGVELDALPQTERDRVTSTLAEVISSITNDTAALGNPTALAPRGPGEAEGKAAVAAMPSQLLGHAMGLAAGLAQKQAVRLDVISPLLLDEVRVEKHTVEELLSGEVMFHFGGFFDEEMRRSDFDLGYRSTLAWLKDGGLQAAGLDESSAATALQEARARYAAGDGWRETGTTTVGSLVRRKPWLITRLTGKIGRVLVHDLLHHPKP